MNLDSIINSAFDLLERSMQEKLEQKKELEKMKMSSQEKLQTMINQGLISLEQLKQNGLINQQQIKESGLTERANIESQAMRDTADIQGRYGLSKQELENKGRLDVGRMQGEYGLKEQSLENKGMLQNTNARGNIDYKIADMQGQNDFQRQRLSTDAENNRFNTKMANENTWRAHALSNNYDLKTLQPNNLLNDKREDSQSGLSLGDALDRANLMQRKFISPRNKPDMEYLTRLPQNHTP